MILVFMLQETQEVLGSIAKEADVFGLLVVAVVHLENVVVILGLLVNIDKLVEVRVWGGWALNRATALFVPIAVAGLRFLLNGIGVRNKGNSVNRA